MNHLDLLNQAHGNDTETAVQIAVEVYKDVGKYSKDVQAKAKALIEEIIIETGQSEWKTKAGKVYFPKPSVSARYDTKALDALCARNDELKRILWPHRKETERPGSMTIR